MDMELDRQHGAGCVTGTKQRDSLHMPELCQVISQASCSRSYTYLQSHILEPIVQPWWIHNLQCACSDMTAVQPP